MDELTVVIFKQVEEMSDEATVLPATVADVSSAELDEIAEIQQAVLEITQPALMSYTLA